MRRWNNIESDTVSTVSTSFIFVDFSHKTIGILYLSQLLSASPWVAREFQVRPPTSQELCNHQYNHILLPSLAQLQCKLINCRHILSTGDQRDSKYTHALSGR